MNRFNISEWALAHRSFVWFLVIIIVAAGGLSYRTPDLMD
jgi:multidrug efflux pump subunit AcrB